MPSQWRQPSPSSSTRAASKDTLLITWHDVHTNLITHSMQALTRTYNFIRVQKYTSNILTILPQNSHEFVHICHCAHLLRALAFRGPGDELVPKMPGANGYWSQGADLCQGLSNSSLLPSALPTHQHCRGSTLQTALE